MLEEGVSISSVQESTRMVQAGTSILDQYAAQAREEIDSALDTWSEFDSNCPTRLRDAIRHSLLSSGKRLRPLLVLMTAEACGCSREAAMPAACAVEMVHTYSLIHDDLPAMDDDETRRGKPTCHVAFDEATAILAGDALLAGAFEVLSSHVEPASIAAACCIELSRATGPTALVGGQMDDLLAEEAIREESEWTGPLARQELLQSIHARKTGALIRASVRLGAVIAQVDSELLHRLDLYGEKIGLAFQIADDLLDARGDASTVGKAVGKDIHQGKLTFPGVWGVDESACRAEELVSAACDLLGPLGARAEYLIALAQYVLKRDH